MSQGEKKEKDVSKLTTSYFEDEIKTSYLNYAYSVITSRAIPDCRDGLKPVHRRILYSMGELNVSYDKPTRKSARVVGDVMGKYHPHGDSSIYMAAVKMAQDFSIRYPMIIGQGNFGSIDDDPPAAMRYTEMKLSKVAGYMLEDLEKKTVDFRPNFDETLEEPKVLPGKFPNLICNGTAGIAVGFATDMLPHNFKEVAAGIGAFIDNPKISIEELMKYIPGPDFPTAGILTNRADLLEMYRTGHGSVQLCGKIVEEDTVSGKNLIITEVPYRVIKSRLVEEITNLMLDSKHKFSLILRGIKEVRDESSKDGIRVAIILNRDADVASIKTVLYSQTALAVKLKVNMVVLVDNQPRVLSLKDLIHYYVEHRRDIIIRRTKYDLENAEKRLHIIEGLIIAVDNIDEVIKLIRGSQDTPTARSGLMTRFKLSEIQAQAILDMRLQKLTGLETKKLKDEKDELEKLIHELRSILESPNKRDGIIKKELEEMVKDIGDARRTRFEEIETNRIEEEELISNEAMLLTVSKKGFVIRETGVSGKMGSRGSRGRKGDVTDTDRLESDDYIFDTVSGNLKDTVLFVTDAGRVYSLKGYEIRGHIEGKITRAHIKNIERLREIDNRKESITAVLMVSEFKENHFIAFITKRGKCARISLSNFDSVMRTGINAIKLTSGDSVAGAVITDGSQKLFVVKRNAKGFRIPETEIPVYNRGIAGAKGTSVSGYLDEVIGMGIADESLFVVFITKDGKGRKVKPTEFSEMVHRGAKGYKLIEIGKDRELASFAICTTGDSIVITTKGGRRIQFPVNQLESNLLKFIDLAGDDEVSALSTIKAEVEDVELFDK